MASADFACDDEFQESSRRDGGPPRAKGNPLGEPTIRVCIQCPFAQKPEGARRGARRPACAVICAFHSWRFHHNTPRALMMKFECGAAHRRRPPPEAPSRTHSKPREPVNERAIPTRRRLLINSRSQEFTRMRCKDDPQRRVCSARDETKCAIRPGMQRCTFANHRSRNHPRICIVAAARHISHSFTSRLASIC